MKEKRKEPETPEVVKKLAYPRPPRKEEQMYSLKYFQEQGKLGGVKGGAEGGRLTASKLTPAQRKAKASKASKARWAKRREALNLT